MAWVKRQDTSGGQRDYLNATDTAGRPMAVASIIFTLFFMAAIVLLLFSAGNWAYQKFIQNDGTATTQENVGINTNETGQNTPTESSDQSTVTATDTTTSGSSEAPTQQSNNENSQTATQNTNSTPSATITTPTSVPNTGIGSVLSIFVASSLFFIGLHHLFTRIQNK